MPRSLNRASHTLRPVTIQRGFMPHAEGSCLIAFGQTRVICTASVDEHQPAWMRGQDRGWVTGEYAMLPRATHDRTPREASRGKQGGRTLEIQRLIGRALRSVVTLEKLGQRTIWVDCDVIGADGGTRTASITGAYVALVEACRHLQGAGKLPAWPIVEPVAAVSCGIVAGEALLDLDYAEDSRCQADMNFVMTGSGRFVEIQGTAESHPFTREEFDRLADLAGQGIRELVALQEQVLAQP